MHAGCAAGGSGAAAIEAGQRTLYQVLGVEPGASREEVRKAFHRAALRLHPDKAAAAAPGTCNSSSSSDANCSSGGSPAPAAGSGEGGTGSGAAPRAQAATDAAADADPAAAAAGSQAAAARAQAAVKLPAGAAVAEYMRVRQAWDVLSDAARRAEYDRQLALAAASQQVAVTDTLPLSALQPQMVEGEACLVWPCRCGGAFAVAAAEAEEESAQPGGELLLPCTTCSLHILVVIGGNAMP